MIGLRILIVGNDRTACVHLEKVIQQNSLVQKTQIMSMHEVYARLSDGLSVVVVEGSVAESQVERVVEAAGLSKPPVPVIVTSAREKVAFAVNIIRKGAFDFIVDNAEMGAHLHAALCRVRAAKSQARVKRSNPVRNGQNRRFQDIIVGGSPELKSIFKLMNKASQSAINVSVTGETGVGKELVAKSIHANSAFREGKFVSINVSAIPSELIESELFGHEKGAFTGAVARKVGKFELADGGTLFLDEVAEMSAHVQVKLLRALQERCVTPIGGNTPIPVNIRLIIATHKSLADEVAAGNFRQDLFFRLQGLTIELPPLRNRSTDILVLARHFIGEYARNNNESEKQLSRCAQEKLMGYSFPGNVRELRSCIELAMLMAETNEIKADDICFSCISKPMDLLKEELTLKEYKIRIISWYLNKYHGDVYLVASKLNVGKSTIYRTLRELESA